LQSAVDDLRHYVPGSQVASKLGSLLATLPGMAPKSNGHEQQSNVQQQQPSSAPRIYTSGDPKTLLKALNELAALRRKTRFDDRSLMQLIVDEEHFHVVFL
ncbi:hypothetical protein ACTXT7_015298, partial [Hymenolepis weldensis]